MDLKSLGNLSYLLFFILFLTNCKTTQNPNDLAAASATTPIAPKVQDFEIYGSPTQANYWANMWENHANTTQSNYTRFFESHCNGNARPTCVASQGLRMFAASYSGSHCAPNATQPQNQSEYQSMTDFTQIALESAFGNSTSEFGENPDITPWVCWHFTAKALERRGIMSAQTYINHTKSLRGYLCSESLSQTELNQIGLQSIENSPAVYSYFRELKDPDIGPGNCGNRVQHINRHSAFFVHKDIWNPENSIVAQINGPACSSGIVFSRLRDVRNSSLGAPDPGGNMVYSRPNPTVLTPPGLSSNRIYLPIIRK